MKRPKWIILYHNSNASKIEKYNVFEHGGVRNDIADAVNVCKTKRHSCETRRRYG